MRVKEFLKHRGEFFLDAGSGSIPLPEYLEYSSGYKWRVCLDFSRKALIEARPKAKGQGLYVLGDVTKLPFKDDVFDATVALHVLYHVPGDEQKSAVVEIHRTMKPESRCVILYSWFPIPNRIVRKLEKSTFCLKIWRKILQTPEEKEVRPLYFHAHDYKWFERNFLHQDGWDVSIRCWRSVDSILTRALVPGNFLGHYLMRLIFRFETVLPNTLARIGRFPMIIIHKRY
ncbi:MAG: class I SAM-dependent methyltransferase [Candidatus Bathyarchaeota archaeon]|nr:class I SAM-dependent methyltransferase [Candidatus Bathyarchaeota archaeon]